jgi:plasmid stabilization system protein ParE
MKITVLEEADSEFAAAVAYYDSQEAGLGQRFEDEIDKTVLWLAEHPHVCQLRRGIYRRMNLQIFPYYIPYIVRESTLWVVAIAHSRRRPEYWIRRTARIA